MLKVVSISLGSSSRNHTVETEIAGKKIMLSRLGTDGDWLKARQLFCELDGKVDAFGLGGMDLYVYIAGKRYTFRQAVRLIQGVHTPVLDGSGLKNTLEKHVINLLQEEGIVEFVDKKILLVSGADRFGMAEALIQTGAQVVFGDLLFGLGLPFPMYNYQTFCRVAQMVLPLITQMPFSLLYPTGEKQTVNTPKFTRFFAEADIIAGDFLFIKRYMPGELEGKIIITNTVTAADIKELADRGVHKVITTTPEFQGRSFGTNVLEAMLVALSGAKTALTAEEYLEIIQRFEIRPRVVDLRVA
ncbi:MAG: quinate 5-dehydrogenase [Bacillota bacterium]